MRSTEETYVFRKNNTVVQTTVLVNARTKEIVQMDFKNFTEPMIEGKVDMP